MTHLDSMHICSKRSCWPLTSVDPSPRYADWSGSPRVCPHVALCVQVMASALYHRQTGWATRTRRSRELVAFVVLPAWRKDLNPRPLKCVKTFGFLLGHIMLDPSLHSLHIPSGKLTSLWKITIFNGKIHYKWPFPIATLNYQRISFFLALLYQVLKGGIDHRRPYQKMIGQALPVWCDFKFIGWHYTILHLFFLYNIYIININ